ncbi:MAG: hypothetical protein U1A72_11680 [Sulfuritalea sp.]|nr:hypothetical protein [Candidatus Nanopelagicales bacterium]MDZ4253216.1 hypothetical protein [Sulfuritalea sp.]
MSDDMNEPTDPKLLGGEEDDGTEVVPKDDAPTAPEGEAEEPEPAAEPASEPARDAQIPRARFDEVNEKLHAERDARAASEAAAAAAQAELAALKAAPPPNIQALEKEYATAFMSGEEDKAAEIRASINAELVRQATEAAFARAEEKALQREADRDYKGTYAQVLKDYPFLDPKTGSQEAIAEGVEWRDYYVAKGKTPAEALVEAAKRIAPAYAAAPADPDNLTRLPDPRKAAAVARGAAAARAQPAAPVAGVGNRAVPTAPAPQTQEEYEKLPEAERNKLLA